MEERMKQDDYSPGSDRMKKHVKITKQQKKVLLDFLEKNFEYVRGAFKLLPSSESDDKNLLWENITSRLNTIGPVKTSNMWRKTCADLRMQIKKKVIEEKELSDEDKRMGKFYGLRADPLEKSSRLANDRVTPAQKTKMVELIRDHFWYNQNTLKLEPKAHNSMDWDEIGERLNQLGGSVKGTIAWRKCWSDIKCDVGKKFTNGAVPKILTEDEYKIATIYGWLNGEQVTTTNNDTFKNMDVAASPVQYVIDSSVIIKSEEVSEQEPHDEVVVSEENEDFVIEQLDEDEHETESQSMDDSLVEDELQDLPVPNDSRTVFVGQINSQSTISAQTNDQNSLLEQILTAQLRTNTLLEQLLQKNSENNLMQSGILDELKNNSFMMVNRAFSK